MYLLENLSLTNLNLEGNSYLLNTCSIDHLSNSFTACLYYSYVYSCSVNGEVCKWETESLRLIQNIELPKVASLVSIRLQNDTLWCCKYIVQTWFCKAEYKMMKIQMISKIKFRSKILN